MSLRHSIREVCGLIASRFTDCGEQTFRRYVMAVYSLLLAANILTHELWRDELQAWMIAAASGSFGELFSNLRYDGHPALWYIILYGLTRLSLNPFWMQAVHMLIAMAGAYVFVRFAPLPRLQRALFVFGYFPLYEYAAISRNYAAGVLLVFIICAVFRAGPGKRHLLLAVLLFFLAQASAYGLLLAISLVVMMVVEAVVDRNTGAWVRKTAGPLALSLAIVAAGFVCSAAIMRPKAPDALYGRVTERLDAERMQETLGAVWKGMVPLPRLKHCYWNRNLFAGTTTPFYLAAGLLLWIFLLQRNWPVLMFLLAAILLMLGLMYFVYVGFLRHSGHFYIALAAALWLGRNFADAPASTIGWLSRISDFLFRRREQCIYVLLSVHLAAGLHASVMEWVYPFSQAKNTARYIREHGLETLPLFGDVAHSSSAVAGYLNRPMYYARTGISGTFMVYSRKAGADLSEHVMFQKALRFADARKSDILMVLSRRPVMPPDSAVAIAAFEGSIQRDEDFYLYLLKYGDR